MDSKLWGAIMIVTAAAGCGSAASASKEPAVPASEARPAVDVPSCPTGDGALCFAMGTAYLDGTGVAKDLSKAAEAFRKACDAESAAGCSYAAELIFTTGGDTRDAAEGYRLREKACKGRDALSCNNLGSACANGNEGASKVDFLKAKAFYETACQLRSAVGCFNLGNAYRLGEGVGIDMNTALKNFELACELGGAKGCTELAIVYYEGTAAPQDTAKAVSLFDKGCKLGSDVSCQNYRMLTAKTTHPF